MTADLRRLALREHVERQIRAGEPVCFEDAREILALLDERDRSEKLTRSLLEQLVTTEQHAEAAERRVAALEEGLRRIVDGANRADPQGLDAIVSLPAIEKARALLRQSSAANAAAQSEPHGFLRTFADGSPGVPAALPAEVEE